MRKGKLPTVLVLISGIGLFLLFPGASAEGVRKGLRLSAGLLIPSLFPVSVLAGALVRMHPYFSSDGPFSRFMNTVFGVSGACAPAFCLGLLGGFPLGAHLSASLYREDRIGRDEAEGIAPFANNAGPAFLIGAAGQCLGSGSLGAALLVIQLLSALSAGLLLRGTRAPRQLPEPGGAAAVSLSSALPQAIGASAAAMLRLTGAVVLFQALSGCVASVLPLNKLPSGWQAGLEAVLELSGGIALLRGMAWTAAFPLASALINWGGCCVHLQAAEALGSAGLSVKPYFLGKLVQACFGFLYGELFLLAARQPAAFAGIPFLCALFVIIFVFFKKSHWKSEKLVL